MNIRKCKVEKNREWSASTQKHLAAALGVSALVSLTACDPVSTSGSISAPDENSSSSEDAISSSADQKNVSSSSIAPVSGVSSAFDEFPKLCDYDWRERLMFGTDLPVWQAHENCGLTRRYREYVRAFRATGLVAESNVAFRCFVAEMKG